MHKCKNVYIGWDIGGAHTKICIQISTSKIMKCSIISTPLWSSRDSLKTIIRTINETYSKKFNIINAITMSGEMSDCFQDRAEGVVSILALFCQTAMTNYVFTSNNGLLKLNKNRIIPKNIASMNWLITARLLTKSETDLIAVDLGSTTTDIILIRNNKCINKRNSDLTGLQNSELIYTGVLRTPIHSVTNSLTLNRKEYQIIPEDFARMSDIYRLLKIIPMSKDYTTTSDGRTKSELNTYRRLSRIFGFDYSKDRTKLIMQLSKQIMSMQTDMISCKIKKHINKIYKNNIKVKLLGMGIGENLLRAICRENKWLYIDYNKHLSLNSSSKSFFPSYMAPSSSLCVMIKNKYEKA